MKTQKKFLLFFLFVVYTVLYCDGQTARPNVQFYSIEDGLSHNQILSAYKDQNGMMWILALDKMNRFDGREFKVINNSRNFSPLARIIGEDATGDLWIRNGYEKYELLFFNTEKETYKTFVQKFENTPLENYKGIEFYFPGNSGQFFFGTKSSELLRYDPETETLSHIQFDEKTRVFPFFEDSEGIIWAEIMSHTSRYKGSSKVVGVDKKGKIIHQFYFDQIVFTPDKIDHNQFSFSSHDDFYIVDKNRSLQKYPLSSFGNRPILDKDAIGFHWIKYDPNGKQFWHFREGQNFTIFDPKNGKVARLEELDLMEEKAFNDFFIDEEGINWVATSGGLYKLRPLTNDFKKYLYTQPNEKGKESISCRKIDNSINGDLYVSTEQGVFLIENKKTKTGDRIINSQKIKGGDFFSLANLVDTKNNLWTSSSKGIHRFQQHQLEKTWTKTPGLVWSLFEGERKLWIGDEYNKETKEQLKYIDLQTDELLAFDQYNGFERLRKSTIYAIQKLKGDSLLWLVTNKGLFTLDETKGIQAHFSTQEKAEYYFPVDELKHLYEDEEGIIWLATSQGLLRWNREEHSFQRFTTIDGLSHNNLHAVYEDDFGFLWMSSDYGLNQFQKSTQKIKTYLPLDGVTHHEFNRIAHHQIKNSQDLSQNGMIYFGGLNGLTAFHPKDFVEQFDKKIEIPIVLLKAEIFRKKTNEIDELKPDFEENKKIVIYPGDQSLNLEFALLDYTNPKDIRYEYRIKGLNENWTSRKDNTLLISGLAYGKHELTIRARTGKGAYSKQELRIPIHVLRPFYLQLWFGLLSIVLLGALIFWAYKRRTRNLIQQKKLLETEVSARTKTIEEQSKELRHLDKIKSRFFANVSHELRTPLTLILGPLNEVLKRNRIQAEDAKFIATANRNAKNLLKLTNEILDLTKLEVSKMELEESPVFILEETRRIFSLFETEAYQKGIKFQFVNEVNPALEIQLDLNKFEKVINNLLSNALKFTDQGEEVLLKLEEQEQNIRIEIQDTGKGISPADLPHVFERFYQSKENNALIEGGTGIGLALCLEFAKLFKGRIWAASGPAGDPLKKGSTFYFEFPKKEVEKTIDQIKHRGQDEQLAFQEINTEFDIKFRSKVGTQNLSNKDLPTILVVEDNIDLREFLELILQTEYKVLSAENGAEAWQIIQGNKTIDLIVSDLMMPVMDGFQLLENLKSDPKLASIPVVMLTARVELQDKLKALRIGVDDYILKPFQKEELLVRIQNLQKNAVARKVYQNETVLEVVGGEPEEEPKFEQSSEDQDWLIQVEKQVRSNISNFEFNADFLAKKLFLSRRQLDRRLKVLTGLTTGEYIRETRLEEARNLIESRSFRSIKEVCFEVGIKSPFYFSKQYQKRFGISPTELLKK